MAAWRRGRETAIGYRRREAVSGGVAKREGDSNGEKQSMAAWRGGRATAIGYRRREAVSGGVVRREGRDRKRTTEGRKRGSGGRRCIHVKKKQTIGAVECGA